MTADRQIAEDFYDKPHIERPFGSDVHGARIMDDDGINDVALTFAPQMFFTGEADTLCNAHFFDHRIVGYIKQKRGDFHCESCK